MSDNENEYNQYTPSGHEYVKVDGILKKIEQSSSSGECGDSKTPRGVVEQRDLPPALKVMMNRIHRKEGL